MRGDLIQTFKILNNVDDLPINTFFKMANDRHNYATRNTVTILKIFMTHGRNKTPVLTYSICNLIKSF